MGETEQTEGALSISVQASRSRLNAMKALAKRKKTSVAKLVRQALDNEYGTELAPLVVFFEERDHILGRMTD